MSWTAPADSQILAIHAALVPTENGEGEIVYFGGDQHNPAFINSPRNVDATRRMNCVTRAIAYVRSPAHDLFCCGHAQLPDGRLLIGGGTAYFPNNIPPGADPHGHGGLGHFPGHRGASIYNPQGGFMMDVASMRPNPDQAGDAGGGRWYPTLVTLASGDVLIVAGHPAEDDTRHNNHTPERYRPIFNSWKIVGTLGAAAAGGPDLYPRLHVLRSGEVFCTSRIGGIGHCFAYNAYTGGQRNVCDLPLGDYHGFSFPSVPLPLLPGDGYRARFLLCGAPDPQRIALDRPDGARPAWGPAGARTIAATGRLRRNCLAVLLPTGQVAVVGGVNGDDPGPDDTAHGVRLPELYDPQIDWGGGGGSYVQAGTNQDAQGTWDTPNDPAAVTRNYHSTALLMPDGSVWTGGSSINARSGDPATTGRLNYEIWQPPYPAGARPELQEAPGFVAWGQPFTLRCTAANTIRHIALMRCGSCTHAFDGDQRHVSLRFDGVGEGRIQCEAPPNGAVAPPGAYLLFVIDEAGRPCQRARFVRIGGSGYLVLNRSQFAREEVSTLSPRVVGDALLLVLDGYLPADLALPAGPTLTFHFADGGGTVPGMRATLLDIRSETGSFTPGVAQRFVLEYGVAFDNLDAFDTLGTDNRRDVFVDVVLPTALQLRGQLTLFRDAKPYMKDGDKPWLSIDVRVVQRPIGVPLAGAMHTDANAGTAFVAEVLGRMNSAPRDDNHPFARLATEQDAARLELSSHVAGVRIFNYAFARVRYRAPVGRNATDVRLFFRTLTTVGTSFDYNETTLYRRVGSGPTATPQFGMIGARTASIPYFASPRGGDRLAATDPPNVQTLPGQDAAEVTRFFGAWLDFNQRDDLRALIRGEHQCLIAELHYPVHSAIPRGAAPAEHDSLSQRNLAIVESDNPGGVAGHVVQHTFELAPFNLDAPPAPPPIPAVAAAALDKLAPPDVIVTPPVEDPMGPGQPTRQGKLATELMIRWGTLPRDAIATIYLPDVDFASLLEAQVHRPGYELLELVDANTVRCRIGEVTFLPVPASITRSLPGLVSIHLPPTVRTGQRFRVTAHQVSGGPLVRKVTGSFEFEIPVSTGPLLLAREERKLAVLRWIGDRLGADIAWRLVFDRYLEQIADRVRAFGGNPDAIKPSPAGGPRDQPDKPDHPDEPPPGDGKPCPDDDPWHDGSHDPQAERARGRIVAVHYDCHGRFTGFDLDTCPGLRHLAARGKVLEVAVVRAAADGVRVTVAVCKPERACGLTVHY